MPETKKFTITYDENDVVNKKVVIEARTPAEALTIFLQTYPLANDFRIVDEVE